MIAEIKRSGASAELLSLDVMVNFLVILGFLEGEVRKLSGENLRFGFDEENVWKGCFTNVAAGAERRLVMTIAERD